MMSVDIKPDVRANGEVVPAGDDNGTSIGENTYTFLHNETADTPPTSDSNCAEPNDVGTDPSKTDYGTEPSSKDYSEKTCNTDMTIVNSVSMQPYIPLVDISSLTVPNLTVANPTSTHLPPQIPPNCDPVQNSVLKGDFSVVQCQNGTLLIPIATDSDIPSENNIPQTGDGGNAQSASRVQADSKQYECAECNKSFSKKSYLWKHKARHKRARMRDQSSGTLGKQSGNSGAQAVENSATEGNSNSRRSDAKPVENGTTSPNKSKATKRYNNIEYTHKLICIVCDRAFLNKVVLIKHMLTVHVREVHQCGMCRRSFSAQNRLKKHMESHSEENVPKENGNVISEQNVGHVEKQLKQEQGLDENAADISHAENAQSVEGSNAALKSVEKAQEEPNDIIAAASQSVIKQEPNEDDTSNDMEVDTNEQKPDTKAMSASKTFEDFYYDDTNTDDTESDDDDEDYDKEQDRECTTCEVTFRTIKGLRQHIKRGHRKNDRKFPCMECGKEFIRRTIMLKHLEEEHPEKLPFQCDSCELKFGSENGLRQHRKRAHNLETEFKCQTCSETFVSKCDLNRHMRKHKNSKRVHCDVCNKTFKYQGWLSHRKVCAEAKFDGTNYICEECNKSFKDLAKLKMHRYTTHSRRFQCQLCDKAFGQKAQLTSHMVYHGAEKKFLCHSCSKRFITEDRLKKHMKIHLPRERKHQCDQCDGRFYEPRDLNNHIKVVHRGEGQKHLCNICGLSVTSATNLRNHMLVHTGEKPHKCTMCDAAFSQYQNLRRHMLTHTKEKPHKCGICGKGFTLTDGLKRHMLTHSGEKPYKCDVCEMSFNQSGNLKTHMLLHKPDKPHKCDKCDKAYNHKVCLIQHMKSHH